MVQRAQACQWALTRKQTLWGGGALEDGNLRPLEEGSKRNSAIVSDVVARETAQHGRGWGGERAGMSTGVDTKSNTWGAGALERGHGAPLEPLAQLGDALGGVDAVAAPVEATELVLGQADTRERGVSTGADTKANMLGRRRA